jgi:O-antigen ligase
VYYLFKVFILFCTIFAIGSIIHDAFFLNFRRYNSGISFLLLGGTFFCSSILLVEGYFENISLRLLNIVTLLFGILITFTRGIYLSFIVGFFSIFLISGGKSALKFLASMIVLLTIVGFVIYSLDLTDLLLLNTFNRGDAVAGALDISSVERLLEAIGVFNELPYHPFFGAGIGGTVYVFRFEAPNIIDKAGYVNWWFIHNSYLQVLHKNGIIGFIAFVGIWIVSLWRSYYLCRFSKTPKEKILLLTLVSTIICFMVSSLTGPILTYINTNFFNSLIFATLVVIERNHKSQLII